MRQGDGNVGLDLGDRLFVDQRPLVTVATQAVTDAQFGDPLGQALGEGVVDAGLHEEAVGADTGLPGIAILADQRTLDRRVEVGVVEDDERRIAAEFQRYLLDGVGSPPIAGASPVITFSTPGGRPAR